MTFGIYALGDGVSKFIPRRSPRRVSNLRKTVAMYAKLPAHDAQAATALVDAILSNPGHTVSVHDSESWVVRKSRDRDAILANMGETELDDIRVRDEETNIIGWFRLIYGNGPGETLCDYSANEYCKAIAERVNA